MGNLSSRDRLTLATPQFFKCFPSSLNLQLVKISQIFSCIIKLNKGGIHNAE